MSEHPIVAAVTTLTVAAPADADRVALADLAALSLQVRSWLDAFDTAVERSGGRSVLAGGKSLGGRIASMCVADGMPAAGLVFLGYPLHAPGTPEKLRADIERALRG